MGVAESRTLAHEVTDAFRTVIAGAVALVVVLSVSLLWFATSVAPSTDRAARLVGRTQGLQAALLTEESILRAYVASGDVALLPSYQSVQERIVGDRAAAADNASGATDKLVQEFVTADERWESTWVTKALDPATHQSLEGADGRIAAARTQAFIGTGSASFAAALAAADRVLSAGQNTQAHLRKLSLIVVIATAILLLMIGVACAAATLKRRRRLDARVVGPVEVLLEKVRAVGRGEFGPSPVLDAPAEILALRDGLADMSASLKLQQQAIAARAEDSAAVARRMTLVMEFAREVSDSLTLSNVLSAVTAAGRRLVESPRARVWLVEDDDRALTLRHDSITGDVVSAAAHEIGTGGLGRAALDRRLTYAVGLATDPPDASGKTMVAAVPLVKGTRLIGVLEIALPPEVLRLTADTVDILVATAAQAATAIDAALLYALSESLSRVDALTGLANRRQLDQDLELEVERAGRYGRPMTFFMIDIDHFKRVNDTFGHSLGDTVLRDVADLMRREMRSSDTAYRYGGEEFAVLARDTDVSGGRAIAERIRRVIARRYAPGAEGDISITISVGLATFSLEVERPGDLIDAADRALYAAKRAGRNRVRVAAEEVAERRSSDTVSVLP
jgi:diguanylate cyclase (GGDEF)-like protein